MAGPARGVPTGDGFEAAPQNHQVIREGECHGFASLRPVRLAPGRGFRHALLTCQEALWALFLARPWEEKEERGSPELRGAKHQFPVKNRTVIYPLPVLYDRVRPLKQSDSMDLP